MASGAEGPKGPLVGPLGGPLQGQSEPEEVLRVLVVGEAAAGKTALLQLLEKHAAELGSARIAQQEEDRAKAAAATEVQTGNDIDRSNHTRNYRKLRAFSVVALFGCALHADADAFLPPSAESLTFAAPFYVFMYQDPSAAQV